METSALQAMCDYRDLNLYVFFISGDVLVDGWDRADLGTEKEHKKQLSSFDVAVLIASELE